MYLLNLIAQVEVPTEDVLKSVVDLIGGIKGASALAISGLVVQLLMKFFNSSLSNFAGKYKLLIVYGLSVASMVIASVVSGGSLVSALINGNVLAAVQVLCHQIYSQFFKNDKVS